MKEQLNFKSLFSYFLYGFAGLTIGYLTFKYSDTIYLWVKNLELFASTSSLPDSKIKQKLSENLQIIPTTVAQLNTSIQPIAILNELTLTQTQTQTTPNIQTIGLLNDVPTQNIPTNAEQNNTISIQPVVKEVLQETANVPLNSFENLYIKDSLLSTFFQFAPEHASIYAIKIDGIAEKKVISYFEDANVYKKYEQNWAALVNKLSMKQSYLYLHEVLSDYLKIIQMENDFMQSQNNLLKIMVADHCIVHNIDHHDFLELFQIVLDLKRDYPTLLDKDFCSVENNDTYFEITKAISEKSDSYLNNINYFKINTIINSWNSNDFFTKVIPSYVNKINELDDQKNQFQQIFNTVEEINNQHNIKINETAHSNPSTQINEATHNTLTTQINENTKQTAVNSLFYSSLTVPIILGLCSGIVISYHSFFI